jgi:hypothetical protein
LGRAQACGASQPELEALGVAVQAVQGLHAAALVRLDRLELGTKAFLEGTFNISARTPRRFGNARPLA